MQPVDQNDEQFVLTTLQKGQVVKGVVVQVESDFVWIDVNYKSEGKAPVVEFNPVPAVGDEVEVLVKNDPRESGELYLSRKDAAGRVMRQRLEQSFESGELVRGRIKAEAKGGLTVDFDGVEGYVPLSHMEVTRPAGAAEYLGKEYDFRIIKFERRGRNLSIVVSRKDHLKEKYEVAQKALLENTKVGDVVQGEVKRLTDFGVFVDLGGMDGLIAMENLSWRRGVSPKDIVQPGQQVSVRVVSLDPEKKRIGLSLKEMQDDPFIGFAASHSPEEVLHGKVVKLETYGAFVSLEDGVEGLLHISELSWTGNVKHPRDVIAVGQELQVKLLGIDREARRISLGLRQLSENPFETLDRDYPPGSRHTGKIRNMTDFGIFVELPSGIEGLVRREDISWKGGEDAPELKSGDMIEVQVLRIDPRRRQISLGIKQTQENPMMVFKFSNPVGTKTKGVVKRIEDNLAFLELAPGIEGALHISQVAEKRPQRLEDVLSVGESVDVKITDINTDSGRISLSIKDYNKEIEREATAQFAGNDKGTFRLGDLVDFSKLEK